MASLLSPLPLLAAAALSLPAAAQTGTLDQVSPFASEASGSGVQTASYNFSASSLTWQMQTEAGLTGQLEGFELELTGAAGGSIDLAIHLGSGWQSGTPVWTGSYSKATSSTEIAWIDVTSADIMLSAGDPYLIQVQGTDTGVSGTGTYESPNNNQYPLPLYLNARPYTDEWRIGFHTYVLDGPTLGLSGICGGNSTFTVDNATANGPVGFLYASNPGSYVVPNGPCAGTQLGLDASVQLYALIPADASGSLSITTRVPAALCGQIYAQVIDAATCRTSNVLLVQ